MRLWIGSNKHVDEITCLPCMCTCRYVHVYLCVYVCMYICVCVHMCEWAQAHASQAHAQAMSHTNESCHISMSHVTYQWVMPCVNEPCDISMSHVSHKWVKSNANESCDVVLFYRWMSHSTHEYESFHIWRSRFTYKWVMSHISDSHHTYDMTHIWTRKWRSHVTHEGVMSHMKESCHAWTSHTWISHVTYEWVMSHRHYASTCVASASKSCVNSATSWTSAWLYSSHVPHEGVMSLWRSHVTCEGGVMSRVRESCHVWIRSHDTYEGVMTHTKESCHTWRSRVTYEGVMSHMNESMLATWISHVTHEWVTSHIWMRHVCWCVYACVYMCLCVHVRMSQGSVMLHTNEPCHAWSSHATHKWVTSHMNESRHA